MGSSVGIAAFEYHRPFEEVAKKVVDRGVRRCELATPTNVTLENLDACRSLLESYSLAVTAVASLTKLNSTDDVEATLAVMNESVDIAQGIGCPSVITYFGGHPSRATGEAISRYARLSRDTVMRAADKGVQVLVENHFSHAPGEVTNSIEGCTALMEAVGCANFGLNFDHCNFAIGGLDIVEAYESLKPYIRNIHVKDARPVDPSGDAGYGGRIVTDVNRGDFLFVPVGEGITDNAEILHRVMSDRLDVPVTVEVHVPDERLDEAFDRGVAFCRSAGLK